jgi:MFS family permease
MSAALHVGKLPPAIASLQQALGMSLIQAGFLLSLVQLAGMTLGLALGAVADGLGPRRSILLGLTTLGAASLWGGATVGVTPLLVLRAVEGFGFLLVVLPAPGLIRSLVPPQRLSATLGWWGAYMPTAMALALLCGPVWMESLGWRSWWWALGLVSLLMALAVARWVPRSPPLHQTAGSWWATLRLTLGAAGPWLVAGVFACYSGQWLAVVGFLPTIYAQAGLPGAQVALLTAAVAAANIVGNVAAGRALQRGVAAPRLLMLGFAGMALSSAVAFASWGTAVELRYLAVLLFSGLGGLIPSTLFSLALRVAPHERAGPLPSAHTGAPQGQRHSNERCVASTVGWMQQWSSLGQFAGPPAVAWLAVQAGGWQSTWWFTFSCCAVGAGLTLALRARLQPVRTTP